MNRTQLLQLSADLDRVIELRSDDDESHWLRNTVATVGTVGTAGVGASYLAGRNLNGPFLPGTEGALGKIGRGSARIASYAGDVGRQAASIPSRYGLDRSLASRMPLNATGGKVSKISSILEAVKGAGKAVKRFSSRHENLLTLSAELDQVINFDLMSSAKKLLVPSVGNAALKWGGIGAAGGAIAGGVSGALSDDPNKTALGGAMSGAMAGGTLGALGGAGMRGYKILSRNSANAARGIDKAAMAGMAPKAAAPTATAAADQMAAASTGPSRGSEGLYSKDYRAAAAVGKPSAYAEMPSGNADFIQPRHVRDPMGYGFGGNTINPMPSKLNVARTTSTLRDPNTSVADALTNKRKAIYENGMNTPRGMKQPTVFSSRLQSLVQLSADLDSVLTT